MTVLDVAGRALAGEQQAIDALAAAMSGGGMKVDLSGMVVRCLSSPQDPGVMDVYRYIHERGLPVELGGPELTDESLKIRLCPQRTINTWRTHLKPSIVDIFDLIDPGQLSRSLLTILNANAIRAINRHPKQSH